MTRILLTNDDGIHAPGIRVLIEALREGGFDEIAVIAPSGERSGAGVAITWDRPIQVEEVDFEKGVPAWSIDGTPADCVKLGSRMLLNEKPDLIVAGINAGSNAGRNVLHSGTVGAVIEGLLRGIPGVAFSCECGKNPNFHVAKKYVAAVVRYVLEHPFSKGTMLNVNFPKVIDTEVEGFRMTRQGKGRWSENPYLHMQHKRGPSYWLGGKPEELDESEDSDIWWLRKGYMTACPLHIHELTAHRELEERSPHFESFIIDEKTIVRNSQKP